ncbi:hypothetical protein [Borreliella garinii]|uniref:Uncharacterized protein n=2 Tax=Borreliella garinii TaxID=29519 RepID=B8F1W1_BORGR|nr:hypothetical protein [Borreliella garinii]ACL34882.1 conserved hypothetical protein [Borreliella garinii PBr]
MAIIKKRINIIGSIIAGIIIFASGLGTYTFKGLLSDFKAEILKLLDTYYENKITNKIEEMKNSFQEDFKKNAEILYKMNKETLIIEVKNLLTKERSAILDLLKERIEKYLNELKLEKLNE